MLLYCDYEIIFICSAPCPWYVFILIRHINTDAAVQDDLDEGKIGSNRSYSGNSVGTMGAAHPQSTEAALDYIVVKKKKKLYLCKHEHEQFRLFHQISFLRVIHLCNQVMVMFPFIGHSFYGRLDVIQYICLDTSQVYRNLLCGTLWWNNWWWW